MQGSRDYQTFRNNRASAAGREIANDQTAFENERKQDAALSDEVFTYGLQNGYIDKYTFEFDKDKVKAGVAANDPVAKKFVTDIANRISDRDRFTISGVEEGEDGYYRFPVQNKDGSPGVITDDGTSNNDSPVTALDLDDLVDNTDQVFEHACYRFKLKQIWCRTIKILALTEKTLKSKQSSYNKKLTWLVTFKVIPRNSGTLSPR